MSKPFGFLVRGGRLPRVWSFDLAIKRAHYMHWSLGRRPVDGVCRPKLLARFICRFIKADQVLLDYIKTESGITLNELIWEFGMSVEEKLNVLHAKGLITVVRTGFRYRIEARK